MCEFFLLISSSQPTKEKLTSKLTNERQNGVGGMGVEIVIPGDEESTCGVREQGTYLGLPFIGLDQARLLKALLRQALHWLYKADWSLLEY